MNRFYSPSPAARTRQMISDALALLWTALWAWVGLKIFDLVDKLGGAGRLLQQAGGNLDTSKKLPGFLQSGVDAVGSAGNSVSRAGAAEAAAAHDIAIFLGFTVAAIPILIVLVPYIFRRIMWIRMAQAIQSARHSPALDHILAQRAMSQRSVINLIQALNATSNEPVTEKYAALAELEYSEFGRPAM